MYDQKYLWTKHRNDAKIYLKNELLIISGEIHLKLHIFKILLFDVQLCYQLLGKLNAVQLCNLISCKYSLV